MSIINQMLKDIDKRDDKLSSGGRANYVYAGRSLRSRKWLWSLAGVGSVLVLLAILWVVSLWQQANENTQRPNAEQLKIERMGAEESQESAAIAASEEPLAERQFGLANVNPRSANTVSAQPSNTPARDRAQRVAVPVVPPANQNAESEVDANSQMAGNTVQNRSGESNADQSTATESPAVENTAVESAAALSAQQAASQATDYNSGAGEMSIQHSDSRTATAPALHRRGLEALESGDSRQAQQRFQEALLVDAEYHEARLQLAALQYGRGFAADALELLRDGLALAPDNTEFLLLKARIYDRIEQPGFALELLREANIRLPQDADILIMRANLASDAEDFQLAVDSYQQLVAWRSDQGPWWLGYGYALEKLAQQTDSASEGYNNMLSSAAEAYRRALQDPSLSNSAQKFALDRREVLTSGSP